MSAMYAMREAMLEDATVGPLVTGPGKQRVYPEELPQRATYPAAVITELSRPRDYTHDGDTGWGEGLYQVSCYATTKTAAGALANAVIALFSGFSGNMGSTKALPVDAAFIDGRRDNMDTRVEQPDEDGLRVRRVDVDIRVQYHEDL